MRVNHKTKMLIHRAIEVALALFLAFAPLADARGRWIAGPAGRLWVDDGGQGEPTVVLVHAFAGDHSHWAPELAHLRTKHRAIAFDLRAHGRSDVSSSGAYRVEDFAADIASVVDALGIERFYLVGHSLGGAAALVYAGAYSDRVDGLVMVGAPGKTAPAQAEAIVSSLESDQYEKVMNENWTKLLAGARPAVRAKVNWGRAKMTKEVAIPIMKGVFAYDPIPALAAYSDAKLVVRRPQDSSPSAIEHLAPDVASVVISGSSHWMQLDRPAEFNAALDRFIDQAESH